MSNRITNINPKGYQSSNLVKILKTNLIGTIYVATITHNNTGVFSVTFRIITDGVIWIDWGDGTALTQVLGLGSETDVPVNHDYGGDPSPHTITITGDVMSIFRIWATEQNITSHNLSKLYSANYYRFYNNSIVDISDYAKLPNLATLFISRNYIQDISALAGLSDLVYLRAYLNDIVDIVPVASHQDLTYLNVYGNSTMVYPTDGGVNWAKKTFGTYDFHDTVKTAFHPDWWINDLYAADWDNSGGANTVDLSDTHVVTSISDTARAGLAANGVALTVDIGDLMVVQGDSNSNDGSDWPGFMDNTTWNAGYLINLAEGGKKSNEVDSEYSTLDHLYLAASGYNRYYFIMIGTNDLGGSHRTSAEIIANLTSIYAAAQADSFYVCAVHILPAIGITGDDETSRVAVNTWMNTAANVDLVVPVPALLQDPEDTDYYSDGTHLTYPLGRQTLASAIEAAMGW